MPCLSDGGDGVGGDVQQSLAAKFANSQNFLHTFDFFTKTRKKVELAACRHDNYPCKLEHNLSEILLYVI